jgi:hypothetical protein
MVGDHWEEMIVEDELKMFDVQRASVPLKNVIDPFRLAVFPAIDFSPVGGLKEAVRMQHMKLIHILLIANHMLILIPSRRRIIPWTMSRRLLIGMKI